MKEEAAQRKALKEAQAKLNAAIQDVQAITSFRRRSEVRREIAEDLRRLAEEEEAARKKQEEEEKTARAGRSFLLVLSPLFLLPLSLSLCSS